MFKNWFKKETPADSSNAALTWDPQATQALETSISQAPVPQMLKGKLRGEMTKTAEAEARKNGHSTVTPEDLMSGLMSKLPPDMQGKVKDMMQKGHVDPGQLK